MALKGSGTIVIGNEKHPLDADQPEHKRKEGWTGAACGRFSGCYP